MKTALTTHVTLGMVLACAVRLEAAVPFFFHYDYSALNARPSSGFILGPGPRFLAVSYGDDGAGGTGTISEFALTSPCGVSFRSLYGFNRGGSPPMDVQYPYAPLIQYAGFTLGTAQQGGDFGAGGIFMFNSAQAESTSNNGAGYSKVASFNASSLGSAPQSPLTGNLSYGGVPLSVFYGTVTANGPGGGGTFYKFDLSTSNLTGLHYFYSVGNSNSVGGNFPVGRLYYRWKGVTPLLASSGNPFAPKASTNIDLSAITLYGVTRSGGSNNWGTVYCLDGTGSNFTVLHHFNFSTTDGSTPKGGVVLSGGTLYGTTSGGGSNYAGTVFKINTDGSGFKIIGNFDYSTTGGSPQGDLIISGDTLYGTTYSGGTNGGGSVYAINTNGSHFTILHSFNTPTANGSGSYTNSDGGWSVSGLLWYDNMLLGTTPYGGTNGAGVAYAIVLPSPPSLGIVPSGGNFKVTWPSWASNYMLLQNSSLSTTNWTTNTASVSDNGTNRSVVVAPSGPKSFFRLLSTQGL
jgi:uncharacterized repeat protein (TIGR03803 family)